MEVVEEALHQVILQVEEVEQELQEAVQLVALNVDRMVVMVVKQIYVELCIFIQVEAVVPVIHQLGMVVMVVMAEVAAVVLMYPAVEELVVQEEIREELEQLARNQQDLVLEEMVETILAVVVAVELGVILYVMEEQVVVV